MQAACGGRSEISTEQTTIVRTFNRDQNRIQVTNIQDKTRRHSSTLVQLPIELLPEVSYIHNSCGLSIEQNMSADRIFWEESDLGLRAEDEAMRRTSRLSKD
jgi:hypothetical protein